MAREEGSPVHPQGLRQKLVSGALHMVPGYTRRQDEKVARAAAQAQRVEEERKNTGRVAHLRELFKALNTEEIMSAIAVQFTRSDYKFVKTCIINGVGDFRVGPEHIDAIAIGHAASRHIFDYSVLSGENNSVTISDEEDQKLQLIEGLTKASIGIVKAVAPLGRRADSASKTTRVVKRAHGQVEEISYSLLLSDTYDTVERIRMGEGEAMIGEIALYIGDFAYVVHHNREGQLRSISKYDFAKRDVASSSNNFGQGDIELLNKLIPSFSTITVDKRVSVKAPGIYGVLG